MIGAFRLSEAEKRRVPCPTCGASRGKACRSSRIPLPGANTFGGGWGGLPDLERAHEARRLEALRVRDERREEERRAAAMSAVIAELGRQARDLLATGQWAEAADALLVLADAMEESGGFGVTRTRGLAVRARVAAWAKRRWPDVHIDQWLHQIEILMPGYPLIDPMRKAVRVDLGANIVVVSVGRNGDVQIEDEV